MDTSAKKKARNETLVKGTPRQVIKVFNTWNRAPLYITLNGRKQRTRNDTITARVNIEASVSNIVPSLTYPNWHTKQKNHMKKNNSATL